MNEGKIKLLSGEVHCREHHVDLKDWAECLHFLGFTERLGSIARLQLLGPSSDQVEKVANPHWRRESTSRRHGYRFLA